MILAWASPFNSLIIGVYVKSSHVCGNVYGVTKNAKKTKYK